MGEGNWEGVWEEGEQDVWFVYSIIGGNGHDITGKWWFQSLT